MKEKNNMKKNIVLVYKIFQNYKSKSYSNNKLNKQKLELQKNKLNKLIRTIILDYFIIMAIKTMKNPLNIY